MRIELWIEKNFDLLHNIFYECMHLSELSDVLDSEKATFQNFCILLARLSSVEKNETSCICERVSRATQFRRTCECEDYLDAEAERECVDSEEEKNFV